MIACHVMVVSCRSRFCWVYLAEFQRCAIGSVHTAVIIDVTKLNTSIRIAPCTLVTFLAISITSCDELRGSYSCPNYILCFYYFRRILYYSRSWTTVLQWFNSIWNNFDYQLRSRWPCYIFTTLKHRLIYKFLLIHYVLAPSAQPYTFLRRVDDSLGWYYGADFVFIFIIWV